MDVHVRTKKMRLWSYVSSAAIRIGNDVLEVMGGQENKFWINGVIGKEEDIQSIDGKMTLGSTLSGYQILFDVVSKKSRKFSIDLGDEEKIVISTWNAFVRINFDNAKSKHFEGSEGLMGSFSRGLKLARDKSTILEDLDVFGQEWQVLQSEPKLFHSVKGPQYPIQCEIPSSLEMRRRLGQSDVSLEAAKKACVDVNKDVMDLCVFDVMATNDMSTAGAY